MTHEEFLKAVQNERSIIKRSIQSKIKGERAIKRLIKERYAHLFGKFCKIEDEILYIIEVFGKTENNVTKPFVYAITFSSSETMFKGKEETLGFVFSPRYINPDDLLKVEQNIVSKEEVFNYIRNLVSEIERKF